jgi:hypothetical protein
MRMLCYRTFPEKSYCIYSMIDEAWDRSWGTLVNTAAANSPQREYAVHCEVKECSPTRTEKSYWYMWYYSISTWKKFQLAFQNLKLAEIY